MDNEGVQEIASLTRDAKLGTIKIEELSIRKDPIPLAVIRDGDGGFHIESLKAKLDEWREFPERRAGTARLLTVESLIALINRHKDDGTAVFGDFANAAAPKLIAVIDYHGVDRKARHGKHRAEYAFPVSDEWKAWLAKNSVGDRVVKFDQADLAMFIEDRIADLSSPLDQERSTFEALFGARFATPSELLTLSRGLEVNVSSRVKDIRNLQTGETEIRYDEVHEDGKGRPIKVPGLFVVQIPLFVGGEKVRIITRLRYRKIEGALIWFFQMYRPDLIIRERITADLELVGAETGCPTFEGTPEA